VWKFIVEREIEAPDRFQSIQTYRCSTSFLTTCPGASGIRRKRAACYAAVKPTQPVYLAYSSCPT